MVVVADAQHLERNLFLAGQVLELGLPVVVALVVVVARRSQIRSADGVVAGSGRDHHAHVRAAWLGLGIAVSAGVMQWGTHELEMAWSTRTVAGLLGLLGLAGLLGRKRDNTVHHNSTNRVP